MDPSLDIEGYSLQHSCKRENLNIKQFLSHHLQLLIENTEYIRVVGKEGTSIYISMFTFNIFLIALLPKIQQL